MVDDTLARHAAALRLEEAVVETCRLNLVVWERYLDGICEAGDRLPAAPAAAPSPPRPAPMRS